MDTLLAAMRRVSQAGLWFGGALVLLAAVLIGIDVILRVGLNRSIGGADELSGYALAIGTAWGLGAALLDRAHIRIDSLYILFPTPVRLALDLAAVVLFVGFFGLIAWHGLGVAMQSVQSGSHSQSALETPLIVPQALWLAGLLVFLLTGLVLLLHALGLAVAGRTGDMARAIGTRSAEEEVQEEIDALLVRTSGEGQG